MFRDRNANLPRISLHFPTRSSMKDMSDSKSYSDALSLLRNAASLINSVWNGTGRSVSVEFLYKLTHSCHATYSHLVILMTFMYRLPPLTLETSRVPFNPRRAFLGCLILAMKVHQDRAPALNSWVCVTDLTLSQLQVIERETLIALGHNLHVSFPAYSQMLAWLNNQPHAIPLKTL